MPHYDFYKSIYSYPSMYSKASLLLGTFFLSYRQYAKRHVPEKVLIEHQSDFIT